MKLIVGLGNPGKKYDATRHNVGFMVADLLAQQLGENFTEKTRHRALVAEGFMAGEKVVLAKPLTFMNASGEAVRSLMDFYRLDPGDLLVLVDDMALAAGRLRIRPEGSAGGQNGMKDIIRHLGTQEFARLRVGIGKPPHEDAVRHVLGGFSGEEWPLVKDAIEKAAEAVPVWIREGTQAAMNRFNG